MYGFIYHPQDGRNLARITVANKVFSTVTRNEIGFVEKGVLYDLCGERVCALTPVDTLGAVKESQGTERLVELSYRG
jgi:hypothetical protein